MAAEAKWTYSDTHLDSDIQGESFLSSARCLVYARIAGDAADDFTKVGVIQGYNWGENKQLEMIFELGSDIPYLIPGRTTGQVSISRLMVSGADMTNVLYKRKTDALFKSLKDINNALDLLLVYYAADGTVTYSRMFSNAWLQSRSESVSSGQIIIAENVNILYEKVGQYTIS